MRNLLSALWVGAALLLTATGAHAQQQPVQWDYSFNSQGQAQAVYPGNVTVDGTFVPKGGLTFDNLSISGNLGVGGTSTLNTTDATTLNVAGNSTLAGTLSVSQNSSLNTLSLNTGTVSGNFTVNGALTVGGVPVTGSAGLVGIQIFAAGTSGTYTPDSGTKQIIAEIVGGGGGGAGVAAPVSSNESLSGSGSSGSYVKIYMTSGFSGLSYSVGTGGAGGTAGTNPGSNGTATSFGAGSCAGGFGSTYTTQTAPSSMKNTPPSQTPTACTVPTGAITLKSVEGSGGNNGFNDTALGSIYSAQGGTTPFTGFQPIVYTSGASAANAGLNGTGPGGGGGGAAAKAGGIAESGGNGAGGEIVIYEYN